MQQCWEQTSGVRGAKAGHTEMLGKAQSGGFPPESAGEGVSIGAVSVDGVDKKGLQVAGQLAGGVQLVPQQQNQQLLFTPANLQLAQLQAQLALHRLKLAQGAGTASAATVLNQVLSNVAMSHPLFNQLQTSALVGNPHPAFPAGVLGFPSSDSALGALVGGRFNQSPGNVRLSHPGGGVPVGSQDAEYAKKSGSSYPCDTDRRLQYNVAGGPATAAAPATVGDEQYKGINPPTKNSVGFQRDFYGQDMQGQQLGFNINKQNISSYNTTGHRDQWKGPGHLPHTGNVDSVSSAAPAWTGPGQPVRPRMELYNPEEPTPEPKFLPGGGLSSGCQPPHGREDAIASGARILQPYQVNDYHAVTPAQLPHQCSICDKKVYNLKDWDQHVKGKLHLQNRALFANESSVAASAGPVHYAAGRPSDGSLGAGGMNPMVYAAPGQDVSNSSYLPAAAMTTYSTSDTGLAPQQPESKAFLARQATAGRVVHICNLPEGSCTENDVINLGLPFGKVTNYILMRSTHQAFLEMAYVEAAQAMVQYYQLTPAMINNQKLLIRMSKRYRELQLKKPGKDVQLIIEDITSQRERDEMQEHERYIPERARSRSPLSRSLSPHSHSPSFTSCSSTHSPQGAPCRTQERGTNGLAPSRGSWDWPRRGEDERERDDPWRNGGGVDDDRPNGRAIDRRKVYQKHLDHTSSRSADERGGGGGEGMRGNRDWHVRCSPQGASFASYRSKDEDFYTKEPMYRSEKLARPSYQRHDAKPKRRDGGDHHSRPRHYGFESTEEPVWRTPEEKRPTSPGRGRSDKTSKRHASAEKNERDKAAENTEQNSKDKPGSPQRSNKTKEAPEASKDKDAEKVCQSEDDTDEECWYPKNMEELVTVDEVGGEDDCIIEPDLPELEECASCPKGPAGDGAVEQPTAPPATSSEGQETADKAPNQEEPVGVGDQTETAAAPEKAASNLPAAGTENQKPGPAVPELAISSLSAVACEEVKASEEEEEACSEDKGANGGMVEEPMENHMSVLEDSQTQEVGQTIETITNGTQQTEIEAPSPSHNQDKAISEHSIPLGVEFIVPSAGFYCKLCGLFYTSEDTAKTAHCRSTVHYRNLQKYLSQLAEGSLLGAFGGSSVSQ